MHYGWRAAGGEPAGTAGGAGGVAPASGGLGSVGLDAAVVDAGAAVELVHAAALLHDDVVDRSQRRRGRPCVHVELAERHRALGWSGDAAHFGEAAAILAGDLLSAHADGLLVEAPEAARRVLAELRREVGGGQLLDLLATARARPSVAEAHTIAVYKSGKYTVERPLHLGAALAGRLEELRAALSAFALPLGEAFQLRDDLLGAFGDPAVLGKDVGEDFREAKPTALYAIALERASGADLETLTSRVGRADPGPDDVAAIQGVLERTGARGAVEERIDALLHDAGEALGRLPAGEDVRAELAELADFVTGRDR